MSIARWLVISLLVAACGSDVPPSPSEVPPTPAPPAPSRAYELICGELEPADCEARATRATSSALQQDPGKTIVSLRFHGPSGSYELWFDDGTGVALTVN